jgi:hypothetical protein
VFPGGRSDLRRLVTIRRRPGTRKGAGRFIRQRPASRPARCCALLSVNLDSGPKPRSRR